MKAVSLLQPWAQLVMLGAKRYVARTWQPSHRGFLALHASSSREGRSLCTAEPCRTVLAAHGFGSFLDLPRGVVLGTVTLEDCLVTEQLLFDNPQHELLAFGDYRPGASTWQLGNPQLWARPLPYGGSCKLFDVPESLLSINP